MSQCSICLSDLVQPVCVPCGHVFCEACLEGHLRASSSRLHRLECPYCRQPFHHRSRNFEPLSSRRLQGYPAIRRVYLDQIGDQHALEDKVRELESRLATAETREAGLKEELKKTKHTMKAHRHGEREAKVSIMALNNEIRAKEVLHELEKSQKELFQHEVDQLERTNAMLHERVMHAEDIAISANLRVQQLEEGTQMLRAGLESLAKRKVTENLASKTRHQDGLSRSMRPLPKRCIARPSLNISASTLMQISAAEDIKTLLHTNRKRRRLSALD